MNDVYSLPCTGAPSELLSKPYYKRIQPFLCKLTQWILPGKTIIHCMAVSHQGFSLKFMMVGSYYHYIIVQRTAAT